MKIAIQANPSRGKEIISLLESLGGINNRYWTGNGKLYTYYINKNNIIQYDYAPKDYKVYILEEFEKEFPFKIGDKVRDCSDGEVGVITGLPFIDNMLIYNVDFVNSGQAFMTTEQLKPYKEMKEERNITLTLDKAKEWYKKGGELREIALQAFSEKELTVLPKSWEEFVESTKFTFNGSLEFINGTRQWSNGCLPNKSIGESSEIWDKHVALFQLEQLRDCWRQGSIPQGLKFKIRKIRNKYTVLYGEEDAFLSFCDKQTAEEFLECFRDLIEKAGDLI